MLLKAKKEKFGKNIPSFDNVMQYILNKNVEISLTNKIIYNAFFHLLNNCHYKNSLVGIKNYIYNYIQ